MTFQNGDVVEKYEYNKSRLPEIVLTKHRELTALYDYAFKTAFKNIDYIDKPGWKPEYGKRILPRNMSPPLPKTANFASRSLWVGADFCRYLRLLK